MLRQRLILIFGAFLLLGFLSPVQAQSDAVYERGKVISIEQNEAPTDITELGELGGSSEIQTVTVQLDSSEEEVTSLYHHLPDRALKVGDRVVLVGSNSEYEVIEPYRIPRLLLLFAIFFIIAAIIAGRQAVTSILGLGASLFVIIMWILPQIAGGASPLLISFIGSVVIACVSLYLAHGFNRRTTLSLISTLITLVCSVLIAAGSVWLTRLMGLGSEEAYYLTANSSLDMRGLLLGAIIIGALGVLDDITTAQTATIDELYKANPRFSMRELYHAGKSVGKEHIASLVNTLAIAYVGASLPLFLLLTSADRPLWVIVNSEFFAEEIVRAIAGSMTLVLAVPIATYVAARSYAKR